MSDLFDLEPKPTKAKKEKTTVEHVTLTKQMARIALDNDADPRTTFNRFYSYWMKKGTLRADWVATWRNWCKNVNKYSKTPKIPKVTKKNPILFVDKKKIECYNASRLGVTIDELKARREEEKNRICEDVKQHKGRDQVWLRVCELCSSRFSSKGKNEFNKLVKGLK